MSTELFPPISKNEFDPKNFDQIPDKDTREMLKTGKVPDDISPDLQEDSVLDEYSDKSSYEPYTGIVLDPEDNTFKTSSGMFRDKKEFYEKLTARGYVVRKVFEKKVFDWIEKNAKTTLEAYLMLSTAFSKWKGNNLLNQYYTKLLNDIPQLNREKIKGNPNSKVMGIDKEESTLEEDYMKPNKPETQDWPTHDVTVIPLDTQYVDGKPDYNEYKSHASWYQSKTYPKCKIPNELGYNINEYVHSILTKAGNTLIHELYQDVNTRDLDIDAKTGKVLDNDLLYDHRFVNLNNVNESPKAFLIYIDGKGILHEFAERSQVSFDEKDSLYVLKKNSIILMNKDETELGREIKNPHVQSVLNAKLQQMDDSNPESTEELKSLKSAISKIIKGNPKGILFSDDNTIWKDFMSNEKHDALRDEYETLSREKTYLSNGNVDGISDFNKAALDARYQGDDKARRINEISKRQDEIIEEIENSVTLKIDELIDEIETKLDLIKTGKVLGKVDSIYERKVALEKQLNYLIDKLKPNKQNKSFGASNYKGSQAKYNTTQDQLGVNQGIHGKKESGDDIPVVDDIRPFKRVNYNATCSYANLPVDGVVTNPGAIPTSGQYMYEQDEHWGWSHEDLNQTLFDGTTLRPEIREAMLKVANKFEKSLGLQNIKPVDIYFTGSSANYNYNDQSDIDLHLVYDFEEIGVNAEILIKYFIAKKQVFNNDYNITIKNIPVEVGVENLNEPIVSSAIYSVLNDKWMLEPESAEQLLPQPDMQEYYQLVQKIEKAIETKNSNEIGKVWDELYDIRKQSLATEGEYGKGNAIFKKLRNLGYLDRLKKAYYSSASEELSLESLKEIQ